MTNSNPLDEQKSQDLSLPFSSSIAWPHYQVMYWSTDWLVPGVATGQNEKVIEEVSHF